MNRTRGPLAVVIVVASFLFDGCGSSGSGVDGTWDIVAAGGQGLGPSEMTIRNGEATGFVATQREGTSVGGCVLARDRTEFVISFRGNDLTGTVKELRSWTGPSCPPASAGALTVTGKRTRPASTSDVALDGDWDISTGKSTLPVTITVLNSSGSLTSKEDSLRLSARRR